MLLMNSPALRYARRVTHELHFTGSGTSNVDLGAIHDAENSLWVSLWFKLDSVFNSSVITDMELFSKFDDSTNRLTVWLDAGTGRLFMNHREAGGTESIAPAKSSWTADTWFHVISSCSTVNGQRLIYSQAGGSPTVTTGAGNQTAISLTASVILGNQTAASAQGLIGEMRDVAIRNTDLSATEELDLCKGIIPADATEFYRLNEGHGVTAVDVGTGGNDGTIDSGNTWQTGLRQYVKYTIN